VELNFVKNNIILNSHPEISRDHIALGGIGCTNETLSGSMDKKVDHIPFQAVVRKCS